MSLCSPKRHQLVEGAQGNKGLQVINLIDLLAILQKRLDRALLYIFIREVRSSGVTASITIVHIRKFHFIFIFILSYLNTKPYQLKKKRETIQMSIYIYIKSYNFAGLPRDRASGRMLIL